MCSKGQNSLTYKYIDITIHNVINFICLNRWTWMLLVRLQLQLIIPHTLSIFITSPILFFHSHLLYGLSLAQFSSHIRLAAIHWKPHFPAFVILLSDSLRGCSYRGPGTWFVALIIETWSSCSISCSIVVTL